MEMPLFCKNPSFYVGNIIIVNKPGIVPPTLHTVLMTHYGMEQEADNCCNDTIQLNNRQLNKSI